MFQSLQSFSWFYYGQERTPANLRLDHLAPKNTTISFGLLTKTRIKRVCLIFTSKQINNKFLVIKMLCPSVLTNTLPPVEHRKLHQVCVVWLLYVIVCMTENKEEQVCQKTLVEIKLITVTEQKNNRNLFVP